ncbi:DNA polymerase III alpha subunit [Acidisarcina polymorpha]|uniref:Error-prone DNA polymerase n=1 Tax=Acidisarcina polymorpha TaxID=2211140 RepID=A0A2Z5G862_9BACT|nr:error-prone DNA polymerase [Acidisarcina polymorpha]AXC15160.1 DNA polymerase III alpha subunit [Acidisarcina polymorpha]
MTESYIELHASSAFSFLESASLPEVLIERAAELEMPSMALLDRNGLYGSARFHTHGIKTKINAHIGAEISVADLGSRLTPPGWLPHQYSTEPARLPLLCTSRAGYQNLCQLITQFKMRESIKCEGAASIADLEEFSAGLICMTGGDEGPLAAALVNGGEKAGVRAVERLISIFGRENVYVEIQRHQEREEEWRNQAAIRIARSLKLPILATNGVRYATAYDREVLDIFTAIRHHTDLDHAGRLLAINAERHLRSAKEMQAIFNDVPQAINNTLELSQRLLFQLNDLGYEFPRYPVPDGESMDSFLRKRVAEGVINRYGIKANPELLAKVKKQVERELALIAQLGFAGYFLIVWDIVQYCKSNGILIQGRGSAANSVVCYALEITAIDPVGMELLFERFLSESRGEWPDVDLDLPSGEKREQAIQYVYQRYGELGAAMTANVITYRGKSAAREVGKALGFDEEALGRLSSLVGHWEWRGPNDTMAHSFHHAGFDLQHPRIAKYLELSLRLQDLPRHLGQHSGGMVICQGQLNRVVPIERASMPGRTVVQWDKEDCSDMGLIKVDLLGLGMMAVMNDCLDLIPRHYGKTEDLAQLPENDPKVYETLQRADTVGMFQVESRAQMASLPRNRPTKFYDIVVQVAIIRPGPIVGGNMNPYMRRRQGKEEVTYLHDSLKPVLERTLGVPLFQEQLLRIAMTVAGFTGAEAEELRRAVGMKRSMARMKELEVKLRKGMTERNLDAATQDRIVQGISSFALYGFPESHAASFALIAYASAYFKVHYLAAFTCAMLNNQPMGFYMPAVLVKDAQRHGLRVRVIDILHSDWQCTIERGLDDSLSLRMGLLYVKGLRQQAAMAIVEARERDGPFHSADDLALRVPLLNPRELKQLARVGALNSLGGVEHRRDALWQVEQAGRPVGPLLRRQDVAPVSEDESPLRQMTTEERLVADYSGTGVTVGRHPMAYRRDELRHRRILSAQELQVHRDGTYVRAAGCVIARQRPGTAKGFIFLSMEDETGIMNVIIGPELYEKERVLITRGKFLLVEGKLQNQDTVVHVRADRVLQLEAVNMEVQSHDFH